MQGFEAYKLHAVEQRLHLAVKSIVETYRTKGEILTWRLVHQIEREALAILEQAGDLEKKYIHMMRTSRWGSIPKINEPVDLKGIQALPAALIMIEHAYHASH